MLDSVVGPLRRLVRVAGLDSRLATIVACDVPVLELHDEATTRCARGARRRSRPVPDTLILGCMSMAFLGVAERLSAELGVPVLNPAQAALKTAEGLVSNGIAHSKKAYPVPPKVAAGTVTVF